jgi:hypothetical protein
MRRIAAANAWVLGALLPHLTMSATFRDGGEFLVLDATSGCHFESIFTAMFNTTFWPTWVIVGPQVDLLITNSQPGISEP